MPAEPKELYSLIVEIRRAFNDLKTFSDAQNQDLRVTAAMRALLEHLIAQGPRPVPVIAREKSVTRQHIQQLADALVAAQLARFEDNPAHRRSKLLSATDEGRAVFTAIAAREADALSRLAQHFPPEQLSAATTTVRRLRQAIAEEGDR